MERECWNYSAAPALLSILLICALALVVNVEARVFPPKRYHISPRTKFKGGDASFPFPRRYAQLWSETI